MYEVVEAASLYDFPVFIQLLPPYSNLSGNYNIDKSYGVNTDFTVEVIREQDSKLYKFHSSMICLIKINV